MMASTGPPATMAGPITENGLHDDVGDKLIPASQRPDGTWRKARRVKGGYVPQEEVPLYESKGKKFHTKVDNPELSLPHIEGFMCHKSIPGLYLDEKQIKQKKQNSGKDRHKSAIKEMTTAISQIKTNGLDKKTAAGEPAADPTKRLKNLKKRLREVEALELKIRNKQILYPEPDQLSKVARKNELIMQIHELEKTL